MKVADLSPLYDKKYSCLVCGHVFTSKKLRSRFVKPIRTDNDFGPVFAKNDANNPLFYFVAVCPECGFAFSEDFSTNISQTAKQRVREELSAKRGKTIDYGKERDFSQAVNTYKLAIYSGQLVNEKHLAMAKLCHRLAWLYRGMEYADEERRFLELAAAEFEQAYIISDYDEEKVPEIQILYLVGAINQKLGNYNKAVQFFAKVTEHETKSRYTKYVNLARKQWKIAVEEYRETRKEKDNPERN